MNFSDYFSTSPSTPATQTPKKALESKDEHGVLPVTAKLLSDNAASFSKSSITLYGMPAARVAVVGKVESADETGTHAMYTVNDETGSVRVQNYQNFLEVKPKQDDYVRVVGEVRLEGGEVSVSVINVSVLPEAEAPAAMGFHRIQVVLAECQVAKSSPKMELFTPEKTEVKAETKVQVKAEQASPVKGNQAAEDTPQAIVDFLEKFKGTVKEAEGISTEQLAKDLKLDLAEVQKVAAELLDDGSVYACKDDNHIMAV
jgi:RPA family protein